MSAKRFRIAFSFAGEKRDFVSKVACILAQRFGEEKILYDKYHTAEFSRGDLAFYLPDLYEKEADLVVAVCCPDYEQKEWCGLEWNAIFGLLKKREIDEVMLMRFGHVEGKGLRGLAGYTDLDDLTPEQTAHEILERLAINEGKAKDFYNAGNRKKAAAASTIIPNNLPRLESFFGREDELKQIAEALDPKTRTWGALIDGPGGQGKTSLAVRAAYDCTPDQFDRIIFLSVKTRELDDDGERQLGTFILPGFLEMLNELAREMGQPEINKTPESERIRLLLDALESTRVLLILDNLESLTKSDRGQLLTFVKRLPQGCKAILTSRRRIGSGSELLLLQKLDQEAALETIADMARHNPLLAKTSKEERVSLYEQTVGNPLLLRWTCGQLGRGSCRTIENALAFLRSCPSDNDPLEFIFGDLANEFTHDERNTLAALSYFTLPASLRQIADVAAVNEEQAESTLRGLANLSLVIPDQEERLFNLVPMVAEFLKRKERKAVAESGARLEQLAYNAIVDNGYENYDRFPLLDGKWPTVVAGLNLFLTGANEQLQIVCRALFSFLDFTGRWDELRSLNEQAEARALEESDFKQAGWRAYYVGWVQNLRGQADDVLIYADRADKYWQSIADNTYERSAAIQLRGNGHCLKSDFIAAIAAFREYLDLQYSLSSQSKEVAVGLNQLGDAQRMAKDFAGAEHHYNESLRVAKAVDNPESVLTARSNLALLALEQNEWLVAEGQAREALALSERVRRKEAVGFNSYLLARALLAQGNLIEARTHAQCAADTFYDLASPRFEQARIVLETCNARIEEK